MTQLRAATERVWAELLKHVDTSPDPDGALQGVLSCGWFDGDAYISLDLDQVRETEIYQGLGQPVLIIDILHPLDR